jgi:hypothetical protein
LSSRIVCYIKYFTYFLRSVHPDTRIIAAACVVEIVYERPFDAVFKQNPHKTYPSRQSGVFLLDHLALAPYAIVQMSHDIAHP